MRSRPLPAFAIALAGLVGGTTQVQNVSASPQAIELSSEIAEYTNAGGSLRLRGALFPSGVAGRSPAVVFLHGGDGASDATVATIGRTFVAQGYLVFIPFRRGIGLSAGVGEPLGARLTKEEASNGRPARMRLMARLLEAELLDDALGAIDYVRRRPDVDSSRVAVYGHSQGGMLSVLAAARQVGVRVIVASAPGAVNWASGPELQDMLRTASRNATVPILFFQAANDYDLAPTEQLAMEMAVARKPHARKIYPAFGSSTADGHSFGTQAPHIWGPDVFAFLSEHMKIK